MTARHGLREVAVRGLALGGCLLLAELGHRHTGPAFGGLLPLALGLLALGLLSRWHGLQHAVCPWPLAADGAGAPERAAWLAMLPMMAGLPWLADACSAAGWPQQGAWALHLAVMLLPPALLPKRLAAAQRQAGIALLLAAGGVALLAWPGVQGLMAAMLLHGAAWGLAAGTAAPAKTPSLAASTLGALLLLALGLAVAQFGLQALVLAHGMLALAGVAGLAARAAPARGWRHNPPHAGHRHP